LPAMGCELSRASPLPPNHQLRFFGSRGQKMPRYFAGVTEPLKAK
jgi:hypothetical protein